MIYIQNKYVLVFLLYKCELYNGESKFDGCEIKLRWAVILKCVHKFIFRGPMSVVIALIRMPPSIS